MINLGERAWSLLKLRRLQQRTQELLDRRGPPRRPGTPAPAIRTVVLRLRLRASAVLVLLLWLAAGSAALAKHVAEVIKEHLK